MRVRIINKMDLGSHQYLKEEVRDVAPKLVEESPWCFEVLPDEDVPTRNDDLPPPKPTPPPAPAPEPEPAPEPDPAPEPEPVADDSADGDEE